MGRPAAGIEAYRNERHLWHAAVQSTKPIIIRCASRTEALQTIQRMHIYRALDRKNSFDGTYSALDQFILKNPGKSTTIIIEKRVSIDNLIIETIDGDPIDKEELKQDILAQDNYKHDPYATTAHDDDYDPDGPPDLETA